MTTFKNVTISEVVENNLTPLIDIREKEEYMMGALPHAINIPMFGLLMNPAHFLEKDKTYYLICQSGRRTAQTCEVLIQQGFQVVNVLGGTSEYMETYKKK
ncbi:MAG: rhodanese-like domain-containing protein [Culicoidibacterales bacterium]